MVNWQNLPEKNEMLKITSMYIGCNGLCKYTHTLVL